MRTPTILRAVMTTVFAGLLAVSGSGAASAEPQHEVRQPYNHKAQGNGFHKLSFGDGQTGAAIV